jgi:hypothetical protein
MGLLEELAEFFVGLFLGILKLINSSGDVRQIFLYRQRPNLPR